MEFTAFLHLAWVLYLHLSQDIVICNFPPPPSLLETMQLQWDQTTLTPGQQPAVRGVPDF